MNGFLGSSMYETQDIVLDEFGRSDSIVPVLGCPRAHKKQFSEKESDEKSTKGRRCSLDSYQRKDEQSSSVIANHNFFQNEPNDNDKGIDLDFDWPDISNIEDFIGVFRNWTSTFGYGSASNVDDLSWFSSSVHPDSEGPHAYAEWLNCNAESKVCTPNEQVCNGEFGAKAFDIGQVHNEKFLFRHEDADIMSMHMNLLETQYLSPGKACNQHFECENSRSICHPSQNQQFMEQKSLSSSVSWHQTYSSSHFSHQMDYPGFASSRYTCISNPSNQMEYGLPIHQVSFHPITSNDKIEYETSPSSLYKVSDHVINTGAEGVESSHYHPSNPLTVAAEVEMPHQPLQQQNSVFRSTIEKKCQKHLKFQGGIDISSEFEAQILKLLALEFHASIAQESSCMSSVFSDDLLLEAASLQQLQDVMDQLDVKSKLCMRDSLYHLARSAEQRHCVACASDHNGGCKDTRSDMEETRKLAGFVDLEIGTSPPIDPLVAHLLFYKPSEPTSRSAEHHTTSNDVSTSLMTF